jgi:hypothetical protein
MRLANWEANEDEDTAQGAVAPGTLHPVPCTRHPVPCRLLPVVGGSRAVLIVIRVEWG